MATVKTEMTVSELIGILTTAMNDKATEMGVSDWTLQAQPIRGSDETLVESLIEKIESETETQSETKLVFAEDTETNRQLIAKEAKPHAAVLKSAMPELRLASPQETETQSEMSEYVERKLASQEPTLPEYIQSVEVKAPVIDVVSAWKDSAGADIPLMAMDNHYWALPMEAWRKIIDASELTPGMFKGDRFDCDDFAVCFTAETSRKFGINSVGIVGIIPESRTFCSLLVTDPLRIVFLEPQDKTLIDQTGKKYPADGSIALL